MRTFQSLTMATAGFMLVCVPVQAAEFTGRGTVIYVGEHIGDRQIANMNTLGQDHLRGVIIAEDPANPLHLADQDCIGSSIVNSEGIPGGGAGYCDGRDKDGDVFFMWYRDMGPEGRWEFLGGTGKFDGVTGGGTTTYVAGEPAGRMVIKWEGKWMTK